MTTTTPTTSSDAAPAAPASAIAADELDLLGDVVELSGLRLVAADRLHGEAGPDGFVVGYRVEVADDEGRAAERVVYVATAPSGADQPGVLRMRDESGDERAVWVHPNDPRLPGLAHAVIPVRAASVLAGFDGGPGEVAAAGHAPPAEASLPDLEITAYRPGKRAVVRATRGGRTVYLKVVPPRRAAAVHDRHASWHAAGLPVPRPLGRTDEGIVGLEEQHGLPAADVLELLDPEWLLDDLDELRRRIAAVPSIGAARASLASRADWYVRRVTELAPGSADRIAALRDAIVLRTAASEDAAPAPAPVTIHGDLHLGQLFVDESAPYRVVGLIDVDTAGLGDPADDDAALWAHLVATAAHAEARGDAVRSARAAAVADAARARWARGPLGRDEAHRRHRVAAIAATHLLGHALTGTLHPHDALDRAERLLEG